LIDTEANYIESLKTLKRNFIGTMHSLTEEEKRAIFSNTLELYKVHKEFYEHLFKTIKKKPNAKKIGDIFIEFKER